MELKLMTAAVARWLLALALTSAAVASSDIALADNRFVALSKPCHPDCTKLGNCNAEEGRCECPWGRTGPACENDSMAICKGGPNDPGSCGNTVPKNCACYDTCFRLYCHHGHDSERCEHELGQRYRYELRCYTQQGQAQQTSVYPEDLNTTVWYRSVPSMESDPTSEALQPLPKQDWGKSGDNEAMIPYPLSACAHLNHCSGGQGFCFRWSWMEQPECGCHKGFNGTDCSVQDNTEACWFAPTCNGHGVCKSGFCHCEPGFWGMGCSRSKAFALAPPAGGAAGTDAAAAAELPPPSRTRLRIYMYEFPWDVVFPYEFNDITFGRDPMYTAEELFIKYLMHDDAVRTENPYEANMFFMPIMLYFYIANVRNPRGHVEHTTDYVRRTWPFYNRTGGRDHFYFVTGDRGTCLLPRHFQDTAIKVVHWGAQWRNSNLREIANRDYGCMQVKRDVVVPPINMFDDVKPNDTFAMYQELEAAQGKDPRRTLLFSFAGAVVLEDELYSGGARQAVYKMLKKEKPPDVKFVEGKTEGYRQLMRTSKFCIAPYGVGWGLRLVQAMEHGCIPVIVQDHIFQPFEEFMPYEHFSVRMRVAEVPNMLRILRAYDEAQLAQMRLQMAKYYQAFIWHREYNGTAYEWTLMALERRMHNMWAEHFRHRRHHQRRRGASHLRRALA